MSGVLPRLVRRMTCTQLQPTALCSGFSTAYDVEQSTNIKWHEGAVPTSAKETIMGQQGCVVWFTGLSGSGKSTVACTVEHALAGQSKVTALLDGDNIRHGLNKNLGFSAQDRHENIRRIGEVSKLFMEAGLITLVSFISPYRQDRDQVRARIPDGRFVEVFMKVPIELCEQRDPKGLYKKARAGQLKGFTGIDDPYEEPLNAEVQLEAYDAEGQQRPATALAAELIEHLRKKGFLNGPGC
ncbi:hypothetical protein QJQ45_015321 [Haematococcus lacustris]|nr:hypothetical protein QJQ45_015321 [Haematococcus lacustris]